MLKVYTTIWKIVLKNHPALVYVMFYAESFCAITWLRSGSYMLYLKECMQALSSEI